VHAVKKISNALKVKLAYNKVHLATSTDTNGVCWHPTPSRRRLWTRQKSRWPRRLLKTRQAIIHGAVLAPKFSGHYPINPFTAESILSIRSSEIEKIRTPYRPTVEIYHLKIFPASFWIWEGATSESGEGTCPLCPM